ncbi:LysE family translocator [Nitratireductor sp. ZSWI3]|uniref:LysE family translocator n=1 Tax=Nitratireductor sp. ZSWI3 TaxID=2966359 RepID=UPI00214FB633|nr:LysE family translocator [Nitratireductor sp. ZSWI3]MCR4268567.1 LysE family translocator [Nitratireductor sp. ZSWI3]
MIDLPLLIAFLAAASVLVITPGLDTAMILRAVTVEGRWPAVAAASGIALGCLAWGTAVALGLGALLRASELAYAVLKFSGAAYLIFLGVRLLIKPRNSLLTVGKWTPENRLKSAFLQGFLSNLFNPKIGVFYAAFLPQFVPAAENMTLGVFFLTIIHVFITFLWFFTVIALTGPLVKFLRQPKAVKTLDRLTGGVFVAFGLKLAA